MEILIYIWCLCNLHLKMGGYIWFRILHLKIWIDILYLCALYLEGGYIWFRVLHLKIWIDILYLCAHYMAGGRGVHLQNIYRYKSAIVNLYRMNWPFLMKLMFQTLKTSPNLTGSFEWGGTLSGRSKGVDLPNVMTISNSEDIT